MQYLHTQYYLVYADLCISITWQMQTYTALLPNRYRPIQQHYLAYADPWLDTLAILSTTVGTDRAEAETCPSLHLLGDTSNNSQTSNTSNTDNTSNTSNTDNNIAICMPFEI